MDNALALDPVEASVLLLWAVGVIYVCWRFVQCRSVYMLILLVGSFCIPGLGICYAAGQAIRKFINREGRV